MNIPNSITIFRIILIPVFIAIFFIEKDWAPALATFVFWLAAITDWLDGYLARKLDQQSDFGAFMDPLADKLMVTSALILLVWKHPQSNWVLFSTMIILAREIFIPSFRQWMSDKGMGDIVAVSFYGKAKTVAQMFAILFLIYAQDLFGLPIFVIGEFLLVWAALLTILSMLDYIRLAWKNI